MSSVCDSASVNISLSSTNVRVNGSINVTLVGFGPCCDGFAFLHLLCLSDAPGSYPRRIAYYIKYTKSLKLRNPMPREYRGRVKLASAHVVTIDPVRFADEKTKYYFVYEYYTGKTLKKFSKKMELQNVFGMYNVYSCCFTPWVWYRTCRKYGYVPSI